MPTLRFFCSVREKRRIGKNTEIKTTQVITNPLNKPVRKPILFIKKSSWYIIQQFSPENVTEHKKCLLLFKAGGIFSVLELVKPSKGRTTFSGSGCCADCSGCCADCSGCSGCSGCSDCSGYSCCSGCSDYSCCSGYSGCSDNRCS